MVVVSLTPVVDVAAYRFRFPLSALISYAVGKCLVCSNEFVKKSYSEMVSIMEIMQLCRLCLVKEQVNVPIFDDQGDIRQICLKITACLPVKISKEDKLPKKICDGCLYKLELLHQFYNTTVNAEKQLLSWIEETNMDINSKNGGDLALQSQPQATVKQEKLEPVESTNENSDLIPDSQSYILQQQQLQYETDFQYKELKESNADSMANVSENSDEPIAKRPRRRRQATKPVPPESLDSSDNDNDAGDSMLEMTVTKTEEESESDGDENVDDPEPAKYGSAGDDTEQPGPSGLGKGGTDAPYLTVYCESIKEETDAVKANSGKRIWTCKTCDAQFENRKSLTYHRNQVHLRPYRETQMKYLYSKAENTYTCNTCDAETKTPEEMEAHVLHHEEKYTCPECNDVYVDVQKLSLHMKGHWDDDIFRCPLCKYITPRRSCMSIHINTTHLKKYLYYCRYCGKGFHDPLIYKEHENIHVGGEPVTCIVCQKKFTFTRNLVSHQIRNHKATILGVQLKNQCPVCRKSYSKAITLENHMKLHDRSRPRPKTHLCDTCGKGFAQKGKLVLHYRVHTGYKPHKCSYCEKSFTKRDYLVMHERIHSGEKPYCCMFCGKCFNQDASLRIHVRSHTGERPYVCQICQHGFVSRGALKVHMNSCAGI